MITNEQAHPKTKDINPKGWFRRWSGHSKRSAKQSTTKMVEGCDIRVEEDGRGVSISVNLESFYEKREKGKSVTWGGEEKMDEASDESLAKFGGANDNQSDD